jgi:hypothetical protein
LLKHPVAVGDVPGVTVFQPPEAHLLSARILATVLEQGDSLALLGDAEFAAPKQDVGFLKKLLQGGLVHEAVYQPAGPIHERLENSVSRGLVRSAPSSSREGRA